MPKVVVKSGAVVELVLGTSSEKQNSAFQRRRLAPIFRGTGVWCRRGGPESVVGIIMFILSSQDFLWAANQRLSRELGELFPPRKCVDGVDGINMKSNTATHWVRVYITIWLRQNTALYPSSHNHGSEQWVPPKVVTCQTQLFLHLHDYANCKMGFWEYLRIKQHWYFVIVAVRHFGTLGLFSVPIDVYLHLWGAAEMSRVSGRHRVSKAYDLDSLTFHEPGYTWSLETAAKALVEGVKCSHRHLPKDANNVANAA